MTESALILTLAYVGVAALLLNLNLATRYGAGLKTGAILLVSILYFGAWHGHRGLIGWPSPDPMPETFRVLWITIEDPDKAKSLPGSIYYWVRSLDEAGLVVGPPRAHGVPWDEERAEEAQAALDQMEAGELLNGRRTRMPIAPLDDPSKTVDRERGMRGSLGEDRRRPLFEFLPVAPPSLPAKDGPQFGDSP